jgi:DNA repair protein RadC
MPRRASRHSKASIHRQEQPQQHRRDNRADITKRLLERGPAALSDAELVSLFLLQRSVTCGPLEESERLIAEYGSLRGLLSSRPREDTNDTVSNYNFATLQAALELARRHYHETMISKPALVSSHSVVEFVRARLRDLDHEVFGCVFLDTRMRALDFKELFQGSVSVVNVQIGEVVRIALSVNATGVIAVHNHPTGFAEASASDRAMSLQLKAALKLVDILLLDHLIIGDGVFTSMADRGLL